MSDDIRPTVPPRGPAPAPPADSTADQSTDDGRTGPYVPGSRPADAPPPPGYEILGELGRGGMGVVYKARQLSLNRIVALKMVLGGGYATAGDRVRFLHEVEAAAKLHHPNVVGVYEVGQHAGLPYFTLEYVEGGSLTRHAKDPLAPKAAAELVEQIARGVAHAHANGIIHRDLKPDNVLLASGGRKPPVAPEGTAASEPTGGLRPPLASLVPKVADFGLAKTLESGEGLTATGAVMGTPSYMAPEQAAGDAKRVGPGADVYALGAVLYRLLTGRPPFAAPTPFETIHQVLTADPPAPSELVPKLPRDLVTVCLKCLRKDPRQRYATADELADDLRRFLGGEPITARPVGRPERAWKWTKRHRPLVTAAAVVFLALSAGIGVATWQAVAAHQAAGAEREAKEHRGKANDLLLAVFADLDPAAEETEGTPLRALLGARLDEVARQLDAGTVGDDLAVARLRHGLGLAQLGLGHPDRAELLFAKVVRTQEAARGPDHPDTLSARNSLALAYRGLGRFDEAARLIEETLRASEAVLGPDHPDTLTSRNNLGEFYRDLGRAADAARVHQQVLAARAAALGGDHPDTLTSRNNLATAYFDLGRFGEAARLHEQTTRASEARRGPNHPHTLRSRNNLGETYRTLGRAADAARVFEQTARASEAALGPDHPITLTCRSSLGAAYWDLGRLDEAVRLIEVTLKWAEVRHGPGHPDTFHIRNNLAVAYRESGRAEDAVRVHERTLALAEAKLGPDHPDTLRVRHSLAAAYGSLGRFADAVRLNEQTLRAREARDGPDHPLTLAVRGNLAATLLAAGRPDDARRQFRAFVAAHRAKAGPDDPGFAGLLAGVSADLLRHHQPADAEPLLRECLAIREKKQPTDWSTSNTRSMLGAAFLGQERYADAEPFLVQGYDEMKKLEAMIPPAVRTERLRDAAARLADLYAATGKPHEAAMWRAEAAKYREVAPPPRSVAIPP